MKRFYRAATVVERDDGHEIRLDGKPLRTPAKAPLAIPTAALAEAIAAEWQSQGEVLKPGAMVLTQLANTAIDLIRPRRREIALSVLAYGDNDLLCYRAAHPEDLVLRQHELWQPLLDWAALRYDAPLTAGVGLMPVSQAPAVRRALEGAIEGFDEWVLAALQDAVGACGSLVIGLALIERRLDAAAAFEAAELDSIYQIELWGEDAEALDRHANLRAALAADRRFVDLVRGER